MNFEKITFSAVGTLVTLHPGGTSQLFPEDLFSQPNLDQFALSPNERGLSPLFMNYTNVEILAGNNNKTFSNLELIAFQIKNSSDKLIYHLGPKVDLNLSKVVDGFFRSHSDYENSDQYEDWLNWYQRNEFYEKGISFLAELRAFDEELYVSEIVKHITNPQSGLRAWVDTEVGDNIKKLNKKYSHWKEDIVILLEGKFHIELAITERHRYEFSFKAPSEVLSVFVRNYDEN